MSTYPSFEKIISRPNKKALLTVKRSLKSMIPQFISFLVLVRVVFWITAFVEDSNFPLPISPRILGLIPLLMLLEILRRYFDNIYIFGDEIIKRRQGRLSLSLKQPSVKYIDIRGLIVSQSFWGRILGYGDIFIGTAAQDQNEVVVQAVSSPYELVALIEEFRAYINKNLQVNSKD